MKSKDKAVSEKNQDLPTSNMESYHQLIQNFWDYLFLGIGSSILPKNLKYRHGVNLHKMTVWIIYLYWITSAGYTWDTIFDPKPKNIRIVILFIQHSFYGIMWCVKDVLFPDEIWKRPATILSVVAFYLVSIYGLLLDMYCLLWPEAQLCLGPQIFQANFYPWLGLLLYITGLILHFGSDCQKYFQLRSVSKNYLITNGFFRYRVALGS